ncbi:MAG: Ig-like domain-containing protein [bacterium]
MRPSLIVAAWLLAACASVSPPAGGPEDKLPPRVVRVTPDTNGVNVRDKVATFFFDEIINDRGTGASDVSAFFLVSPSDGEPHVSWHRSRIDVRPRHGFRPNTAYTITLLPGLSDLRSNSMKGGATLVFSTGATIPTLRIVGTVFDWAAEHTAPRALVEALTSDSIKYLAQADSVGKFVIGPLGPGTYLVRGIIDQNSNRALDRTEAWDSVRVTTPQAAPVELLAAPRDTLPARLLSVAPIDSVTLRLTFDRLLDPTQTIPAANVRVVGADSTPIPIAATRTPREEDARAKALQAAEVDSARRADSLAGKPRPAPPPVAPAIGVAARPAPAVPSRPPPFASVTVVVGRPLAPNTSYRASVTAIRALSGRVTDSERQFTTPRPAPPRPPTDSTTAPGAPPAQAPAPNRAPPTVPSAVPQLPTVRPAAPTGGTRPARP